MLGVGGFPRPGRELAEAAFEVAIDEPGEHVVEVTVRVDAVQLAAFDQRGEDGPVFGAFVGAGEQSVLAIEGQGSDGSLDRVGIEFDAAVVQEADEPAPAGLSGFPCAGHGLSICGSGDLEALVEQNGELRPGHGPFPWWHSPLPLGEVQDQEQELQRSLIRWKMAARPDGPA